MLNAGPKNLQDRVANVAFEGKGLWATEGVVTIPLIIVIRSAISPIFTNF